MTLDPLFVERLLTAGVLASLAVAVAFGPELRRVLVRLRSRRVADASPESADRSIEVEPQRS